MHKIKKLCSFLLYEVSATLISSILLINLVNNSNNRELYAMKIYLYKDLTKSDVTYNLLYEFIRNDGNAVEAPC